MFEALSLSSVLIIVVFAYIFRKPIKQLNNDAPVVISNCMTALTKSSAQLDAIISTNCVENNIDCQRRIKVALDAVNTEELPNIQDAYNQVMQGAVKAKA